MRFKLDDYVRVKNGVFTDEYLKSKSILNGRVIRRHNNHDLDSRQPDIDQITISNGQNYGTYSADELELDMDIQAQINALQQIINDCALKIEVLKHKN